MKKITVDEIDVIFEQVNNFSMQETEKLLDVFGNDQPVYFNYIMRKEFELLGDDAHELLLFNAMTLWYIIKQTFGTVKSLESEGLDEKQDANWSALEELPPLKSQDFEDYVEPLIADHPQDELLYFILDTFQEEEEEEEFVLDKESKVPIFIALKTFIDAVL